MDLDHVSATTSLLRVRVCVLQARHSVPKSVITGSTRDIEALNVVVGGSIFGFAVCAQIIAKLVNVKSGVFRIVCFGVEY